MNVLVTGGAGFIGSHLVDALLADGHMVRVLDDLSMGLETNVAADAESTVGDIRDLDTVERLAAGCEVIFHQAALGSVKRSVETPLATDGVNVHGTLTVLEAARRQGVRRVVAASSSSVYGGVAPLPAREDFPPAPRSPYAVSKAAGEHYSRVFAELLGVETVVLRYFNVYGPRQRADSPYAAVIPLFVKALREGSAPLVHGDGMQGRDFTYVSDAVQANLLAAECPAERGSGRIYNVAGGEQHTVLDLLGALSEILGVETEPTFTAPRPGDVRDSQADLTSARRDLGYVPRVALNEGLRLTVGD